MVAAIREQLRVRLLTLLDAASSLGLTVDSLAMRVHLDGIEARATDVERELQYLADKAFAVRMAKSISPELGRWRITAEGRDYLAREGF